MITFRACDRCGCRTLPARASSRSDDEYHRSLAQLTRTRWIFLAAINRRGQYRPPSVVVQPRTGRCAPPRPWVVGYRIAQPFKRNATTHGAWSHRPFGVDNIAGGYCLTFMAAKNQRVRVELGERSYDIVIGPGLLAARRVSATARPRQARSDHPGPKCGATVCRAAPEDLKAAGYTTKMFGRAGRGNLKVLRQSDRLFERLPGVQSRPASFSNRPRGGSWATWPVSWQRRTCADSPSSSSHKSVG